MPRHHLQKSEEAARSAGLDEATITSILKDLPSEDRTVTTRYKGMPMAGQQGCPAVFDFY